MKIKHTGIKIKQRTGKEKHIKLHKFKQIKMLKENLVHKKLQKNIEKCLHFNQPLLGLL